MRTARKSRGLALAVAILLVALAGSGVRYFTGEGSANDAPVAWRTEQVTRGTIENTISCTGTLAAVGTVNVGTQVSGRVAGVEADYNDRVRKGQVLAVLDQSAYTAALEAAEASVEKMKAELAQAEAEEARNRPLREREYLSAQEFLRYQTASIAARASLRSSEANLTRARTDLSNTVIRSPIDGTVIQRDIEEGQTVAASLSAPTLFVIAEDLSRMQIEADVDENDIGRVRRGQTVRFSVPAHPAEEFSGTVFEIRLNPEIVSNVVTYTVVVNAANRNGLLLPGMTATMEFVVERAENVLIIPNAALSWKPSGQEAKGADRGDAVHAAGPGGAPMRLPVTLGMTDGTRTAMIAGPSIAEGTALITGVETGSAGRKAGGGLFGSLMPRPGGNRGRSSGSTRSSGGGPGGGPPPF